MRHRRLQPNATRCDIGASNLMRPNASLPPYCLFRLLSNEISQDLDQDEKWTNELVDFADRLEPWLTEFSGPVHDLPVDSGPLDYFKLFFPDSVLNMIVEETNRYAQQQQEAKGAEWMYWKPATLSDIRKYIYTLITFGHHQVPELSLIWSSDPYWRVLKREAKMMGTPALSENSPVFSIWPTPHTSLDATDGKAMIPCTRSALCFGSYQERVPRQSCKPKQNLLW
ncbi:hypothetical protein RRG08_003928 [Elysia crispata]|uniref:PiggyBac transposable element-derived protein domain-containing protein n=1 Tax=Elysia crispata TaxID=231223 RepID=A0AAE0XSV7_9GAST|nr:hypothetical protein RRG08_003928 [Elysia crispata]